MYTVFHKHTHPAKSAYLCTYEGEIWGVGTKTWKSANVLSADDSRVAKWHRKPAVVIPVLCVFIWMELAQSIALMRWRVESWVR